MNYTQREGRENKSLRLAYPKSALLKTVKTPGMHGDLTTWELEHGEMLWRRHRVAVSFKVGGLGV